MKNDIIFNDISVSNEHAVIGVSSKGIYITDNDSKYGTLMQSKVFNYGKAKIMIFVQIDRFLFEFHSSKDSRCDCKIPKRKELKTDPFKQRTELEHNSIFNEEFDVTETIKRMILM